ncbi:MAG: dihydroneopterin aldolase [Candidatus Omnitrophica bacterium]|nr:dihydroneopterin aldolase [Candidatus Omnitrophota bacterium]
MDKVLIEGLRCLAHVGVGEAERRKRQKILVDLEMELDLKRAGRSDEVKATVDYLAAANETRGIIRRRSFKLAEALAEAVAQGLLKRFQPRQVRVRVRKFSVPGAASVGVVIHRRGLTPPVDKSRTTWGFPRGGPR